MSVEPTEKTTKLETPPQATDNPNESLHELRWRIDQALATKQTFIEAHPDVLTRELRSASWMADGYINMYGIRVFGTGMADKIMQGEMTPSSFKINNDKNTVEGRTA